MSQEVPPQPEVRPYLKRLLLMIGVGLLTMVVVAVWAWRTYGGRLEHAPPLPSGSPPLSTVPLPSGEPRR